MLVLARNIRQKIMIGDQVVIEILSINNFNQVKIGITAPESIPVHREEIYNHIKADCRSSPSQSAHSQHYILEEF